MNKSIVYAVNPLSQTIDIDGTDISFGNIVRRYGNAFEVSGGNIIEQCRGYNEVTVNLTILPTSSTNITVVLYKDGTPIPGASATVTGVANAYTSITIPAVIRHTCCCDSVISARISGATGSITNAGIIVKQV